MKPTRKSLTLIILLITPFLLSGVITSPVYEVGTSLFQSPTKVSFLSYDAHDPIVILNDTAFDEMASLESWDGDGSPGTPFIIDNYNITSDETCIEIRHTIRAFKIQNCYISSISGSVGTGIRIYNVTHAAIVDTFVLSKSWSFDIDDTPAPYIENCTIHDSYLIHLGNCAGATITECYIYDNTNDGIYLDTCNNSSISNNEIFNNGGQGLLVESSDFLTITTNTFAKNGDEGIFLDTCNNATIRDNDIWENDFTGTYGGVHLELGSYNLIEANRIWNNSYTGIYIDDSEHVEISNNHIFNNTDEGIYANSGAQLAILENQIHGNGWDVASEWEGHGISFSAGVVDSLIEDNEIFNNTHYGIYAYGNRNHIFSNEVYNHPDWGIAIIMCFNDSVADNLVYNNGGAGIEVYSIGSNVTGNIAFNNELGIHLYGAQSCRLWGNDIGWNDNNALEESSMPNNMWYNNVTNVGNWWGDYSGSGVYYVSNGTHAIYPDMYPSKSLELSQATPISFEILETGNIVHWEASALNPSHYEVFVDSSSVLVEEWDGNDIEYNADGLSHGIHTFEVTVYHISGHSMGNSTTASVEDLTPPSLDGPAYITIVFGDRVSDYYTATDPSGISGWAVNDTINFGIDSTGVLTGITDLPVGTYTIRIEVSDTFGHTSYLDVEITVLATSDRGLPTTLILAIGGGAIILLVVIAIGYKRKKG